MSKYLEKCIDQLRKDSREPGVAGEMRTALAYVADQVEVAMVADFAPRLFSLRDVDLSAHATGEPPPIMSAACHGVVLDEVPGSACGVQPAAPTELERYDDATSGNALPPRPNGEPDYPR